ncbi:MAG: hypothetical protein IT215_07360 [Chitinophagaceae bacterium]|nr:hypothetical protein [Chitinophagaceae bacterium]
MQQLFEKAIMIATKAHTEQKDKSGALYLLLKGKMDEKIIALLHDVVKESETSIIDLAKANFSKKYLKALGLLTKTDDITYNLTFSK